LIAVIISMNKKSLIRQYYLQNTINEESTGNGKEKVSNRT
jgi:hypothetical protein